MSQAFPTVDDLRVRQCYICREEEYHDQPENPPRAWTHPCKCTLIAHETCLLQWIQTSQGNASRAPNALKCPQCGTTYELESDNPLILRILASGNKSLQILGRVFTVCSATAVVAVFGTGIYIISTAYGAYALQEFLGKEMYDFILTDDPSNWPWHAFLNLPLIPLSLILSRTPIPGHILPIIPILLAWPSSAPISARSEHTLVNPWAHPEHSPAPFSSPFSVSNTNKPPPFPVTSAWPPSPVLFGLFIFPVVRSFYRKYFTQFSHWVLGTRPDPNAPAAGPRWVFALNDGAFAIRIGANIDRARLRQGQGQQQQGAPDLVGAAAAGARMPGLFDDDGDDDDDAAIFDANPIPAPAPAPAPNPAPNPAADPAPAVPNAVAAAEQTIEVMTSSVGRLVGGALLMPAISNMMGALLFRASKRSYLLRRFLAVRPALAAGAVLPPQPYPWSWGSGAGRLRQVGLALRLVLGSVWGGTRTWAECDPVWWRNSIGLGLFVVAKDCLHLLHLWLTKRELESRRVKNRSFEGVDLRELDLINPLPPVGLESVANV